MRRLSSLAALYLYSVVVEAKTTQRTRETTPLNSDPAIFTSNLQSIQAQQTSGDSQASSTAASVAQAKAVMDMIGSTCTNNTDCNRSTFCCSKGRCVPGSICYKGQKQAYDHCEYGFECLSRCCASEICSPVDRCVQTCAKNSDCGLEGPCCSFGYCTGSQSICTQGMKADFDMCEAASECQSGSCINGRCTSSEIHISNQRSMNIMIVLVLLMLIIVITTCYYAKVKNDQLENYYRRHSGDHQQTNSMQANEQEERQRRRRRNRSGSSSSDRLRQRQDSGLGQLSGSDPSTQARLNQRRLSDKLKNRKRNDSLNRENLDRLGHQADPLQEGRHDAQPALLFVAEEDPELFEQLNASYHTRTTNRGSFDKNGRMASNSENRNISGVTPNSHELTSTTQPRTEH